MITERPTWERRVAGRELRDSLRAGSNGEPALGTVLSFPGVALAETFAAYADLVWIDMEHGALTVADVRDMAIGARSGGAAALVRISGARAPQLAALVDAGVDGIVVPKVGDATQVDEVVRALNYPPTGARGFAPRRGTGYATISELLRDDRPLCVAQIEDVAGVKNAHEIAAVPGVDFLVVGCADLSMELGVDDPLAKPAVEAIVAVAQAASTQGCRFGLAGIGVSQTSSLPPLPVAMLVPGSDAGILGGALRSLRRDVAALSSQLQSRVTI